jgi:RNA polymerase sigma-70 factor, ECF subfamily
MPASFYAGDEMNQAAESDSQSDARLAQLLARCAARDSAALQRLYELVAPLLFACLKRMLRRRSVAEEALQDVFVTVWQRAAQFDAARGRPMAWLMSITRYRAIDLLRRERLAPALMPELPEPVAPGEEHGGDEAAWLPGGALLERCLALLSPQQRDCLQLAFVAGNSHQDIAQLLGSPLGTVKSWIRRALQSLKTCLET